MGDLVSALRVGLYLRSSFKPYRPIGHVPRGVSEWPVVWNAVSDDRAIDDLPLRSRINIQSYLRTFPNFRHLSAIRTTLLWILPVLDTFAICT
jgi:hypothetical protein